VVVVVVVLNQLLTRRHHRQRQIQSRHHCIVGSLNSNRETTINDMTDLTLMMRMMNSSSNNNNTDTKTLNLKMLNRLKLRVLTSWNQSILQWTIAGAVMWRLGMTLV
jgi:hypothetical protein